MIALNIGLRLFLGVIFAVACGSKLRGRASFTAFRDSLPSLRWLGGSSRTLAAALVPALEGTVAVLVAVPATAAAGLIMAAVVLAGFTLFTAWVMASRRAVTCQCFGSGGAQLGGTHLLRNSLLLISAAGGFAVQVRAHGAVAAPALVLAIGFGLLASVLIVRWEDVAELVRR